MTLLTLVHLGDGPTITFTAATPVQPGPSLQKMTLHMLVHLGDGPTTPRHSSRQGSDTPPRKRRRF